MNHTPTELTDALGTVHRPASGEARIVSLVPSLTELVCDMGLTANLVGRTGFCIHPRETLRAVTKVGGTKDVKLDLVRELAPTHLIVNIDENRRETVEELVEGLADGMLEGTVCPADSEGARLYAAAAFAAFRYTKESSDEQ